MPSMPMMPVRKRGARPLNVDNRLMKTSRFKKVSRYYFTNSTPLDDYQLDFFIQGCNNNHGKFNNIAVYDYKQKLPMWIDQNPYNNAWTKISDANQNEFFLYSHGKGRRSIDNPHDVFPFFDDFDGDSLSSNFIESKGSDASSSISDSVYECHLTADSANAYCNIRGTVEFGINHALGGNLKTAHWSSSSNQRELIGFKSDSNGSCSFVLCGETGVGMRHRNYNGSTYGYSFAMPSNVWTAGQYGNVSVFRYPDNGGSCVGNGYIYTDYSVYSTSNMDPHVGIERVASGGNSAQIWIDSIYVRKYVEPTTWALYPETMLNKYYHLRRGK